ncbi:GNAT family N-acetyltransferase [Algibacter sp. PT7-4]|uniref:GNAT family N-acetyltransferase n=1 Tax=Algibacter ulvanivorans TaxID=3400999 RepID=UPI003AAAF08F
MEIQHENIGVKGRFYYKLNKVIMAEMTYSQAGSNKIIIDHTEVNSSLKGQGIGYKLVEAAVNYARFKHIKIIPQCPFAEAVFKKNINYNDVLA